MVLRATQAVADGGVGPPSATAICSRARIVICRSIGQSQPPARPCWIDRRLGDLCVCGSAYRPLTISAEAARLGPGAELAATTWSI
jgi:hypothetical protein